MSGQSQDFEQLARLLRIMRRLRDPARGCPWDLRQDFASIAPHTLEEAYEVVDAIEQGNFDHLRNELGDLLFQVVFYAQLGSEQGLFGFEDVAGEIVRKLLQRHPHVFPGGSLEADAGTTKVSAEQVAENWEAIKEAERRGSGSAASALDAVPLALPALVRAAKLQKRAATQGFDWPDVSGVFDKCGEELQELREALAAGDEAAVEDELGDLLFSLVNLSRHLAVEPETALRKASRKFERRYRLLEQLVRADGKEPSQLAPEALDAYWRRVKVLEKQP